MEGEEGMNGSLEESLEEKYPRLMVAGTKSSDGKTLVTLALLSALGGRGMRLHSFKCGPDYIDPMFHRSVLQIPSGNLDTFFTGEVTREVFAREAKGVDFSILEGVMGFYDGVGGKSLWGSSYDLARVTNTPVVLVVNGKGSSRSMAAQVLGFLRYQEDSQIRGVILNRVSLPLYERVRDCIQELGVRCFGYFPEMKFTIPSRHLGLVLPEEMPGLREELFKLGERAGETLDLEGLLELARSAPPLGEWKKERGEKEGVEKREVKEGEKERGEKEGVEKREVKEEEIVRVTGEEKKGKGEGDSLWRGEREKEKKKLRIGLAWDESFCFCYQENLALLEREGAELVRFSPLRDTALPGELDGVLLYGGYPELHAKELGENTSMRKSLREALQKGLPCMAECGGFLYLQEWLEDMKGERHPMVGYLPGGASYQGHLVRFGYVHLRPKGKVFGKTWRGGEIPAHEFHYYESEKNGGDVTAQKPLMDRSWECMYCQDTLLAGFPHLYYEAAPELVRAFLEACRAYREGRKG